MSYKHLRFKDSASLIQDHTDSLWLIWNLNQIFWCPVWDLCHISTQNSGNLIFPSWYVTGWDLQKEDPQFSSGVIIREYPRDQYLWNT